MWKKVPATRAFGRHKSERLFLDQPDLSCIVKWFVVATAVAHRRNVLVLA